MTHIMLDLETLSTNYNARIVSIGAVKFSSDKGVYDSFYNVVKAPEINEFMHDHIDEQGFHVSMQTITWWLGQEPKARSVFTDRTAVEIDTALGNFATWATREDPVSNIKVWGNGASFDNVILSAAYKIRSMEQPWKFWNDRCYRTVKNLYPNTSVEQIGIPHNALDDAETQAMHLLKLPVPLL